ncbi:universal stress protein [Ramlibacter albus]|uniref:Universal stress protein n=1 Tax=Ramlibacter albus TaxID=2079448 RepID=A0A923M3P2_9BURK|nr:universal stress protein [Ramlibacter albus]MBC5763338.1 universal stress protein [Ramlibacter albus]
MRTYRRLLVPVDGSATSRKALVHALQIARDGNGSLLLVHCADELAYVTGFEYTSDMIAVAKQAAARLLAEAADIAKSAGVDPETKFIEFPRHRLGETIAEEAKAWNADLIVVGTHGRRGLDRVLLGSGAEQVIRHAPVPVLVIRGGEDG